MKFTLIICTYMRPEPLLKLLQSVEEQSIYPNEILIVDGSTNEATKRILDRNQFKNLYYFLVSDVDRGLTKQRNFGIKKVSNDIEIVCFLDDDTVLKPTYFEEILKTYQIYPQAIGVGGYIINENHWEEVSLNYIPKQNEYFYDGWKRMDGSRFILRKKLGLDSNTKPGFLPKFSHGRSIGFLPPSGKIYEVEQLMGGVSSFRKSVFQEFQFSTYFEGYGLYEDADFTIRVSKKGQSYVNTAAQLAHYHALDGRPNKFKYGKMVVRNGWYVWRVKNPNPKFKDWFKWHAITTLLILVRATNVITTKEKKAAFTETVGRVMGWWSLWFNKPKIETKIN